MLNAPDVSQARSGATILTKILNEFNRILYKCNEPDEPLDAHCLFVIISTRWKFSEYTLPLDGTGVISQWIEGLDDEVQAEFDVRLALWAANDKWLDFYKGLNTLDSHGERFEELTKIGEIPVTVDGVLYRILGVHFDVWEFVMLIGYSDARRRAKVPADVQIYFQERLSDLRRNRHHRQDYELEV